MNLKIAIAQISTYPGKIKQNKEKIIDYIKKAKSQKAEVVIFPELAIPGYMSLDLMLYPNYIKENLNALKEIAKHTKDILVIVGFIDQDKKKTGPDGTPVRYNSAAILYNKKIIQVQDKTLLPDYDVFFENRYFSQGRNRNLIKFKGLKLGVQICEDLWDEYYQIKVSEDLVKKGADILTNISGSPFYIGKRFDREKLIKKTIRKYKIPFIYANTIGCQDGYDGELVFDGQSIVTNRNGDLVYLGKQFEEELILINSDQLFGDDRISEITEFNPSQELFEALVLAIRDYFKRTGFKKAFIGISGGIDSAVVASLLINALGNQNVTGILMPSKFTSKESIEDSKTFASNLGIKLEIISIDNILKGFIKTLEKYFEDLPPDTTEENLQARIRGMLLMAHSNKLGGLVVSTANKTETALGYATLYGDMCGAISPLADVSKLKVYELAKYINQTFTQKIPENIIKKIPTAELRENQTDETSLGASYNIISPLVDQLIEDMKTQTELSKKYSKKVVNKIYGLINISEYKRRQASPAIKVTKKAFGLGRRIPISHEFEN